MDRSRSSVNPWAATSWVRPTEARPVCCEAASPEWPITAISRASPSAWPATVRRVVRRAVKGRHWPRCRSVRFRQYVEILRAVVAPPRFVERGRPTPFTSPVRREVFDVGAVQAGEESEAEEAAAERVEFVEQRPDLRRRVRLLRIRHDLRCLEASGPWHPLDQSLVFKTPPEPAEDERSELLQSEGTPALRSRLDQPPEVLRIGGFDFGVGEVLAEHRDELFGLGQRGRPNGSDFNLEGLVLEESSEGLGRGDRGHRASPGIGIAEGVKSDEQDLNRRSVEAAGGRSF